MFSLADALAEVETVRDLTDYIYDNQKESYFQSQPAEFWPEDVIESLRDPDLIRRVLTVDKDVPGEGLVSFVSRRATRLLAISATVFDGGGNSLLRQAMEKFYKHEFGDGELTAEIKNGIDASDHHAALTAKLRGLDSGDNQGGSQKKRNKSGELWYRSNILNFIEKHWRALAPVFSTDIVDYNFRTKAILPFLEKGYDCDRRGAFSIVYKVSIHPSHYVDNQVSVCIILALSYPGMRFSTNVKEGNERPKCFALKEIRLPTPDDGQGIADKWGNEAKRLREMNERNKQHTVPIVAAFKWGEDYPNNTSYYLMFEWADGGSLENVWKNLQVVTNAGVVKDAVAQMLNLSEALAATHKAGVRHGDLKPDNILCFWENSKGIFGTLKIGDWGLARYHNVMTRLREAGGLRTATNWATALYEAPEREVGTGQLSRQYDLWAMGCIFLEFIIWLLYGYEEITRFRREVKGSSKESASFYRVVPGPDATQRAIIHETVVKWMDHLEGEETACAQGTALGEILTLVRKHLLLVKYQNLTKESFMNEASNEQRKLSNSSQGLPPEAHEAVRVGNPEVVIAPGVQKDQAPHSTGLGQQAGSPEVVVSSPGVGSEPPKPQEFHSPGSYRIEAKPLVTRLTHIYCNEDQSDHFWFRASRSGAPRRGPAKAAERANQDENGLLTAPFVPKERIPPPQEARFVSSMDKLSVHGPIIYKVSCKYCILKIMIGDSPPSEIKLIHPSQPLDEQWDFHLDNKLAKTIVSKIKGSNSMTSPDLRQPTSVCSACGTLDFFTNLGFSIEYKTGELEKLSKTCNLCRLFWKSYTQNSASASSTVRFEKVQSSLRMNGIATPVLSICRSLDFQVRPDIQIGIPTLPPGGSDAHFEIIRQWLQLCNDKNAHPNCHPANLKTSCLPKRLIDVGEEGEDYVRLWDTSSQDTCEYVALSHPWGPGPHFVATADNMDEYKRGIKLSNLPATFRDAITTTRALKLRHLWIDSICINQGHGGDFDAQASTMETIFSSAHCVIAASRARSQVDGFLQNPRDREYVTLRRSVDGAPFYICENIDDFEGHVLNGHLNKRGWVLQEHALARRTIFFTEHQTYWECGDGVRCETLTKMTNNLAAFLGDPNFPRLIMSASQGEKIIRLQNLYKRYSSLGFTRPSDRPIAVDGIQNRLLQALHANGGFGIMDEDEKGQGGLLRRALLWYRPEGKQLTKIQFPTSHRSPPSWSWMAYMGEIEYLDLKFGLFDWEDMRSPWSNSRIEAKRDNSIALSGTLCTINPVATRHDASKFYFDMLEQPDPFRLQCVVLGREQGKSVDSRLHYFILVAPASSLGPGASPVYKRIGVGYMPGKWISPEGTVIDIC